MSDFFSIVPFYSSNDVNSTITILVIGNYLDHACEILRIMKM